MNIVLFMLINCLHLFIWSSTKFKSAFLKLSIAPSSMNPFRTSIADENFPCDGFLRVIAFLTLNSNRVLVMLGISKSDPSIATNLKPLKFLNIFWFS